MPKLILGVGLPRSGKSTYFNGVINNCPIVCPDSIRLELYGQRYCEKGEDFVWATARLMVKSLFNRGHQTVVVDATNVTKKQRARWLGLGGDIELHVIDTNKDVCISRAQAQNDTEIIPIIERMAEIYEAPTEEEGTIINVTPKEVL